MTLASRLQRRLEHAYEDLPWPHKMNQVAFVTLVEGGRGDIATAAKLMEWLGREIPTAQFEWVVVNAPPETSHFIPPSLKERVHLRTCEEKLSEPLVADLLVIGPKKSSWTLEEIADRFSVISKGATFTFLENAFPFDDPQVAQLDQANWEELFHPHRPIAMGLTEGTGLFLNEKIPEPKLPPQVYLQNIRDEALKEDIFQAKAPFSFYFGYAHRPYSHAKFIDLVTARERERHIVIVLNQKSDFQDLSESAFAAQYFPQKRCEWLKLRGYSKIVVKGAQETISFDLQEKGLELRLIVRSLFKPEDMRAMQMAARGIEATGDNSAVEAFEVKPELYFYEDLNKPGGCKGHFLQQQIELAKRVYPPLAQFLTCTGTVHRELNADEWGELAPILQDENLGRATQTFCETIVQNHSFIEVAKRALKRNLWHAFYPALAAFEERHLGERWRLHLDGDIGDLKERVAQFIKRSDRVSSFR